jgi:hypothetical protein
MLNAASSIGQIVFIDAIKIPAMNNNDKVSVDKEPDA